MEPVIGTFLATSEQLISFVSSDVPPIGRKRGKRYALRISDEQAEQLKPAGWNVRTYTFNDDEFKYIPIPTLTSESLVELGPYLDQAVEADDDSWELEIMGYPWEVKHLRGVSARLVSIKHKGE